ncbi:MAG: hypothetical protein A3E80_06540 [Chlamydiae bacterium RIFCSPHIGHO2_12_FULL_49_9]|nr:MAG: hypothetical protein A3E80_06540 [Chlamydiae bacterium RIFCSPHIGHO2_12_FULL_49_9]
MYSTSFKGLPMRQWCWFFCLVGNICSGRPLEIEVSAPSAILMNADTGSVLFEKDAHTPSYPASITKIATALFALDHKKAPLDRPVTISHESLKTKPAKGREYPSHWLETDGTKMGLMKGETVSFETLLYGLMLVSGNDAANAIAESLSDTIPGFVEEMNAYLRSLGCKNTQFRNPHGLHHPEHYTTAYDICLATKKALTIPKFKEIVSTLFYTKPKTNKQPATELRQFNPLLKPGRFYYPNAIGVKTGYTSAAKNTLVAAAEHEGRTLIAVVLGCEKREERYNDVRHLFDAAFAEEKKRRRLIASDHLFTRQVEGAKLSLQAALGKEFFIEFFPAEEPICKAFIHWDIPTLPIKKDQRVGEVRLIDQEGKILKKEDLLAVSELSPKFFFGLKQKFLRRWNSFSH